MCSARLNIKWIIGLAALAAALVLPPSEALAAQVSAAALPATMIAEGEADITVTITNTNEAPAEGEEGVYIRDVYVYSDAYPDMLFSGGGEIGPGESRSFTASYYITSMLLNQAIPITATWTEGGESDSENLSVTIQSVSSANVSVTRSASSKQASPGEEITLTYTVTNGGMSPVNVTSIVDREIAGRESFQAAFALEPGAYLEIPYTYKMGRNTVESAPVVTYTDTFTGETLTATCSAITLGMVNAKISVEVIQGEATENGVTFTLNFTNNGNQRVSEIRVTDELGNRVNDVSFALAVGETKQLTYTVLTDEERYVVFNVAGETSSGDEYSDKTKSYVVRKYIDPSLLGIQFKASVTETLNAAGSIEVQFDISNTGTMTMTDLVISELTQEIGEDGQTADKLTELFRTDSIAPGPFSATQTIYVGDPRNLTFVVELKDPAGNPYSYTAYVAAEHLGVRDAVDAETAQQNVIDALGASIGESINKALNISIRALVILIAISIVAMIILSILERQYRREAARRRAARERQRRQQPEPERRGGAGMEQRAYHGGSERANHSGPERTHHGNPERRGPGGNPDRRR